MSKVKASQELPGVEVPACQLLCTPPYLSHPDAPSLKSSELKSWALALWVAEEHPVVTPDRVGWLSQSLVLHLLSANQEGCSFLN